jgi:hypothetical protein
MGRAHFSVDMALAHYNHRCHQECRTEWYRWKDTYHPEEGFADVLIISLVKSQNMQLTEVGKCPASEETGSHIQEIICLASAHKCTA